MAKKLRMPPPTYKAVAKWVKDNRGYTVKTCWIADVKEGEGYTMKKAHNRKGKRKNPCPPEKKQDIIDALAKAKA